MVVEDYPRAVVEFEARSTLNALPWRLFPGFCFQAFPSTVRFWFSDSMIYSQTRRSYYLFWQCCGSI